MCRTCRSTASRVVAWLAARSRRARARKEQEEQPDKRGLAPFSGGARQARRGVEESFASGASEGKTVEGGVAVRGETGLER